MLKKALNDQTDLETAFAWRAFTNDCLSTDVLGLRDKRPSTSSTSRGSAKKVEKKSNWIEFIQYINSNVLNSLF